MVIYTALGVCRTYLDFQSQSHDSSPLQKALKHASETVFYAPMVCMMFVGFRMRVPPLSQAVKCTMVLSTTFFMIYLLHAISRTYSQYNSGHLFTSTFEKVMMHAISRTYSQYNSGHLFT